MLKAILKTNKDEIILTSIMAALAGITNTFLLATFNSYVTKMDNLPKAMLTYAAILGTMVGLGLLSQYLLARLSVETTFQIRRDLAKRISQLKFNQLEQVGSARLFAALTSDVGAINQLISSLPMIIFNITVILSASAYLFYLSPAIAGIAIGFVVLSLLFAKIVLVSSMERKMMLHRRVQDELFRCYEELVKGFKELRFNRARQAQFHSERLNDVSEQTKRLAFGVDWSMNLLMNWNSFIVFGTVGAILCVPYLVSPTALPDVPAFVLVFFYMMGPISFIMGALRALGAAQVSLHQLATLELKDNQDQFDSEANKAPIARFDKLTLQQARYVHKGEDGNDFVVGPIDLEIHRGQCLFFVGGNGSGKTTAAKMLCGLYPTDAGSIALNGQPISDANLLWYQEHFSTIFSDFYLFQTIKNKRGRQIGDEEINAKLERLSLKDKISVKDGQLSRAELSQGQRKKLALLQAYFEESELYVFDEWAADQDPQAREFFYTDILPLLKAQQRTCIVITHDDRYFDCADRIIKFDMGQAHPGSAAGSDVHLTKNAA